MRPKVLPPACAITSLKTVSNTRGKISNVLHRTLMQVCYDIGRRYHRYGGEGKYVLPNDEVSSSPHSFMLEFKIDRGVQKEQDRLDLQHHAALLLLNEKLHTAPIKRPHRVLDAGTGTGIW